MKFWSAVLILSLFAPASYSQVVCNAGDFVARESSCPATGTCEIRGTYSLGQDCVLDFGLRPLVLAGSARLVLGSGTLRLIAGSLLLRSGAMLDARGQGTQPGTDRGGNVLLQVKGPVVLEGGSPRARIDASASSVGGRVIIAAEGPVEVHGRLLASHLTATGDGGFIKIESKRTILVSSTAELTATGGAQAPTGGGRILLEANEDISVQTEIVVSGSKGGSVNLDSGGQLTVAWVRANATGEGGDGGAITLDGYRGAHVSGGLRAQGNSVGYSLGGDGGEIQIIASYGDVVVSGSILAEGGEPDGWGGTIAAEAAGIIRLNAPLSARALGARGGGGSVELFAGGEISSAALVDCSGGAEGGDVSFRGSRGIAVSGTIDARGRAPGANGGEVKMTAGDGVEEGVATAEIVISSTIDVSGGGCEADSCGAGGLVEFVACNATVASAGRVLARGGGNGGEVKITGNVGVNIDGTVNCQRTTSVGTDGRVIVRHPETSPPRIRAGGVLPLPLLLGLPPCHEGGTNLNCLVPCPRCGDGLVHYPEECDDGNALGCDGCSPTCRSESCLPSTQCVECLPFLGCPPIPEDPCPPPSAPTPSPTLTPHISPTPSFTAIVTPWIPSPTRTLTPSATPTATPTPTYTPTATPSRTRTPTSTRTPTLTATVTPTPRTRIDVVLDPVWPLHLRLRTATPALATAPLRIQQLRLPNEPSVPVKLMILASDCLATAVSVSVDIDPQTPGKQDTVEFGLGRAIYGVLEAVADPARLDATAGGFSPYRCRVLLEASAQIEGNQDPTPWNNSTLVEVNVADFTEAWVEQRHQSVIMSAPPKRIRLRRGEDTVLRYVRVAVANADRLDVAGHAITVTAADGDCATGTVGVPAFHREGVLPANKAVVPNRRRRFAKLPITVHRESIQVVDSKSPYRCTLVLEATGPSGDSNLTDNLTILTLDLYAD